MQLVYKKSRYHGNPEIKINYEKGRHQENPEIQREHQKRKCQEYQVENVKIVESEKCDKVEYFLQQGPYYICTIYHRSQY